MRKSFIYIFISIASIFAITSCSVLSGNSNAQLEENTPTPAPIITAEPTPSPTAEPTPEPAATSIPPIQLVIGATGDIMCHEMQIEDAIYTASRINNGEMYDFDHVFRYIKDALNYPDLTIGNLETVFAGVEEEYSGFPYFNSPDEFFYVVCDAGYDVLTTANNHSYDRGAIGVRRTISMMDENNIYHTGTYSTPEDRTKPLIIDVKGVKVGILSNTYGVQHSRTVSKDDQKYMLSIAEPEHVIEQVQMLKDAGAEIIIASSHWGEEGFSEPIEAQRKTAALMSQCGVDVIFGHHSHVLQPIEILTTTMDDGKEHETLVCWSLGNFIANTFDRLPKRGGIAYAYLTYYPETGEVKIDKCEFLPTYIYNDYSLYKDYHVLPAGVTAKLIGIDDINTDSDFNSNLEEIFTEISAVIGDYAQPIRYIPGS